MILTSKRRKRRKRRIGSMKIFRNIKLNLNRLPQNSNRAEENLIGLYLMIILQLLLVGGLKASLNTTKTTSFIEINSNSSLLRPTMIGTMIEPIPGTI